jgi:glycosyltransferase involved in cell wall biosynthesis
LENEKNFNDVAVLLPCYNEEKTIAAVVRDFQAHLPGATVYVFDNCSSDRTSEEAKYAGATVVFSPRRGKGNVIRHMFATVEADTYLMADGDSTYPASEGPKLLEALRTHHADMIVGTRMATYSQNAFRRFHVFGNRMVANLISFLFGAQVTDVLSGYRAFSREFVKIAPLVSPGFEIETEMTLQAAAKNFVIREVPVPYGERPEGSVSKLNTFSDGFLVLRALLLIFKDYRPMYFFGSAAFGLSLVSLAVGSLPIADYVRFHYVYRVPLAILASGIAIVAVLTLFVGLILETVRKFHDENFELWRKLFRLENARKT